MNYRVSQDNGREAAVKCAEHSARLVLHQSEHAQLEQDANALINELNAPAQSGEVAAVVQVGLDVMKPEAGPRADNHVHRQYTTKT